MGLHVVVFEPRGDCLAVLYDGSIYDPAFRVDNPAKLAFASDHLDWNDERFDFGEGIYAPGLIKSPGALKGGCYDQSLVIGALSKE